MSEPATTPASRNHRRQRALRLLAAAFTLPRSRPLRGGCLWPAIAARPTTPTSPATWQISPRVNGTVVAIRAEDTDLVEQGQVLLELDDADARVALQAAEAALAEAVREVRGLYLGTGQSAAVVAQRTADIERLRQEAARAQAELQRTTTTHVRKPSIATASFRRDALQAALHAAKRPGGARAAQAAIREAESALRRPSRKAAPRCGSTTPSLENHPHVAAAASQVRAAYLALIRTRWVAPVRGCHRAALGGATGERVSTGTR